MDESDTQKTSQGGSAAPARDRLVKTIRRALEDHATPAADPACTFCCGALAALDELFPAEPVAAIDPELVTPERRDG